MSILEKCKIIVHTLFNLFLTFLDQLFLRFRKVKMSTLEESVIDHRTNLRNFNPDLASAVGLLRERRQLFALSQEQWVNQKVIPKKLNGLDVITFNDMAPEKIYSGRVLKACFVNIFICCILNGVWHGIGSSSDKH
jgi:hypothetical protein